MAAAGGLNRADFRAPPRDNHSGGLLAAVADLWGSDHSALAVGDRSNAATTCAAASPPSLSQAPLLADRSYDYHAQSNLCRGGSANVFQVEPVFESGPPAVARPSQPHVPKSEPRGGGTVSARPTPCSARPLATLAAQPMQPALTQPAPVFADQIPEAGAGGSSTSSRSAPAAGPEHASAMGRQEEHLCDLRAVQEAQFLQRQREELQRQGKRHMLQLPQFQPALGQQVPVPRPLQQRVSFTDQAPDIDASVSSASSRSMATPAAGPEHASAVARREEHLRDLRAVQEAQLLQRQREELPTPVAGPEHTSAIGRREEHLRDLRACQEAQFLQRQREELLAHAAGPEHTSAIGRREEHLRDLRAVQERQREELHWQEQRQMHQQLQYEQQWQNYHKQQLRQELDEIQMAQKAHHSGFPHQQQMCSGLEQHPLFEQHPCMQHAPQGQQQELFAAETSPAPSGGETVSPSWVVGTPMVAMDMKKSTSYMHPQAELLQASYEGAIDMKAMGRANGVAHSMPREARPPSFEHPCFGMASHAHPDIALPMRQAVPEAPWPHEAVAPNPAFWAEREKDDFGQRQQLRHASERQQLALQQPTAAYMPQLEYQAKVPAETAAGLASRLGHVITRLEREGDPTEMISDLRDIEASYNAALNVRLR